MALTHGTNTKNAATDAVVDRVDLGSGTSEGRIKIKTAADALLATLLFASPAAFGSASAGVATANAIASQNATGDGTAAKFDVVDRDDTVIWSGTVGTSGADLNLINTSILTGQPVTITAMTYAALPQ